MTSSVFYKFKSQKETSRVEFDGTGISVFELKRDIIIKSGLGDGTDFDLAIFHEDGKEEYDDDTTIIPRSTTVIARRTPASKRGAGRAQRYMTGKMPVNAKNSSRKEQASKAAAKAVSNGMAAMNNAMTEEQRMAAMFQAQNEQWSGQLDEMAKQTKIPHTGHKKTSEGEPPFGYVCYRCGEKGHWIKECPTNDDPNFENRPRIKRTTGIPKSMLRTVEKPIASTGDDGDGVKPPSGIMVDAEGKYVVAVTDSKSWEKFQEKTKSSAAAQEAAALGDKELQDRGLECSIDKRIFIDPMKTPCCEKTYCNDCITNALIESDFTCPNCQTEGVLIDDLKPDDETTAKITAYLDEKNAAAKAEKERAKERSRSPSVKPETASPAEKTNVEKIKAKSKSPSPPSTKAASKSPPTSKVVPTGPATVTTNLKKRPADELLENPKIPKGPKAMQQQEAQKQAMLQQQQMMNGGFPNLPFNPMMMPNFGMPMMNMPGFGMPNMNMNMNMMGMNPMMMNGGMNGGFNGMGFPNGAYNMPNMGMNGNNSVGANMNGGANGNANSNGNGAANGFPNQQKTFFAEPLPNEEDNAYFRKPVNPHRHQGRQRRARPSDYREL